MDSRCLPIKISQPSSALAPFPHLESLLLSAMRQALVAVALLFAISLSSRPSAVCGRRIVTNLPGFDGLLPFELETGYVAVDEQDGVNLFYYFVKSDRNPAEDPLLYWLDGGPGCSGLIGLVLQVGPIRFDEGSYEGGGLPKLVRWEDSWTRTSNIIFVDWPAGTGYSYSKANEEDEWSDGVASNLVYVFIKKWLLEHPEFISNPFYMAGMSYGGKILPIVTQDIITGNEAGEKPFINLKGYLVGNPITTDFYYDMVTRVKFSHGMGLISDELFERARKSCGREFVSYSNLNCKNCIDVVEENLVGLHPDNFLDKECGIDSPRPKGSAPEGRYLMSLESNPSYSFKVEEKHCREFSYILSEVWADNFAVQEALGVNEDWHGNWLRCNRYMKKHYSINIPSPVPYYFNITMKGYQGLVFSGDHDLKANFVGTQEWIKTFNLSIIDDWRRWWVGGQIAGYTRTYDRQMTFATIKGAGHMAPLYKPRECREMVERWISGKAL